MTLLIKRVISNYSWKSVKHNKKAHKAKNVTCFVKCYANGMPKGGDVCLITQLQGCNSADKKGQLQLYQGQPVII